MSSAPRPVLQRATSLVSVHHWEVDIHGDSETKMNASGLPYLAFSMNYFDRLKKDEKLLSFMLEKGFEALANDILNNLKCNNLPRVILITDLLYRWGEYTFNSKNRKNKETRLRKATKQANKIGEFAYKMVINTLLKNNYFGNKQGNYKILKWNDIYNNEKYLNRIKLFTKYYETDSMLHNLILNMAKQVIIARTHSRGSAHSSKLENKWAEVDATVSYILEELPVLLDGICIDNVFYTTALHPMLSRKGKHHLASSNGFMLILTYIKSKYENDINIKLNTKFIDLNIFVEQKDMIKHSKSSKSVFSLLPDTDHDADSEYDNNDSGSTSTSDMDYDTSASSDTDVSAVGAVCGIDSVNGVNSSNISNVEVSLHVSYKYLTVLIAFCCLVFAVVGN